MFVLNSRITVGNMAWSGVNQVVVNRSIHSPADSAIISLPSYGRVTRKGESAGTVRAISSLFDEGDKVKIELGYNGELNTEFEGFVRFLNPMNRLVIECEGYVRQLRLNKNLKGFYASTSVKQLLELAVKGTDISVYVQDDIPLKNITLDNAGGTDIISEIKNICQGVISIFFIEPKKLWAGLTYTAYKDGAEVYQNGDVAYRIGYNCRRDNSLKIKQPAEPVQVLFRGTLATGRRIETASEKKVLANKATAINNNIPDLKAMQKIANEKQYRMNYNGYAGSINAFLQPYCQPGYKAHLIDDRYPGGAGDYLVESTEVTFGSSGASRRAEIGPRLNFGS